MTSKTAVTWHYDNRPELNGSTVAFQQLKNKVRFDVNMSWYVRCFLSICLMTFLASAYSADSIKKSADEVAILDLMHGLYKIPVTQYFAREFKGKYNPEQSCVLLSQFFTEGMYRSKVKPTDCLGADRHPTHRAQDGDGEYQPVPSPKHGTPKVNGNLAEIVLTMSGDHRQTVRLEYYLRKLPVGWRIYRRSVYEEYIGPNVSGDKEHIQEASYYDLDPEHTAK